LIKAHNIAQGNAYFFLAIGLWDFITRQQPSCSARSSDRFLPDFGSTFVLEPWAYQLIRELEDVLSRGQWAD
jgi:hypothetical protein